MRQLIAVLTTVNAPYREQLDAEKLAGCLSDLELAKRHPGHTSTFLSEVPVALQVEFAVAQGIPPHRLAALAKSFSLWSGETYPLAN
jgi:hypothetical protein